ncbi:expressed unknown protein [Seminavis robusta]|uniref:NadR/Ttd14 AAA domain-containing protein n=1 Tax=Seminavis robusta TaxID=568900 RepID=A0A9N8E2W3_9STRA|nr:expressed unknown protein [Seminavis robusta]|eukprot:Sro562_g166960.1 n/a (262) ;mRNA; r:12284-13069
MTSTAASLASRIAAPHASPIVASRRLLSTTKGQSENVFRIVLTGGPCSGKSSALSYLQKSLVPHGIPVYCAPEAATLLNSAGAKYDPDGTHHEQHKAYQASLCRLQLALENNLTDIAASYHHNKQAVVILCDRGVLDNKGYMSSELWQDVLASLGMEEASILEHYAGVIHMDTAAKGALEFYKSGDTVDDDGNPVSRQETPEQARALDDQMWNVWQGHAHHYRVTNRKPDNNNNNKNTNTFDLKLQDTVRAVEQILKDSSS